MHWQSISYSLLPVIAAIAGAAITTLRPPGPRVRSALQHFAAGVVFAVVAVELMPDVIRQHKPMAVIIGFTLGIGLMLGIRLLTRRAEEKAAPAQGSLPTAMLAAIGTDILIDGFLIGIGFAAGAKEGKLLTFALTAELLSLGLALAVSLRESGIRHAKVIVTTSLLAVLLVVGTVLGETILRGIPETWMEIVLSFGLAALLYLVTEELLVEAHEVPETPAITACFFAGFLLFVVFGML
jgi:zinc transporter, ZIP family